MNTVIKKSLVLMSIGVFTNTSLAAVNHSPQLHGTYIYEIDGGYISASPTTVSSVSNLTIGASWDLNMSCGEFDPQISISNQLEGVTEGFSDLMDNIISSATNAVSSLPGLVIQRANPGLYDMLQQGILQGKIDFADAKISCEEVQAKIADSAPFQSFMKSYESSAWTSAISNTSGDAIAAKNEVDDVTPGDDGVEWVCGDYAGGIGQSSIDTINDVVLVGYNILFNRANACSTSDVAASVGSDQTMWEFWPGPTDAQDWAEDVIGNMAVRTCDGCTKVDSTPGRGLTYQLLAWETEIVDNLTDIVDGTTELTAANLDEVSFKNARITPAIIRAIRKRNSTVQAEMIENLASEVAYSVVIEEARLLTQVLRTGLSEPNVSAYDPALSLVNEAIESIKSEIAMLDYEMEVRNKVADETLNDILINEENIIQNTREYMRGKPTTIDQSGVTQ